MIARVGELGLQVGIRPGLPSSRVLGGLPPQSPHLCNGMITLSWVYKRIQGGNAWCPEDSGRVGIIMQVLITCVLGPGPRREGRGDGSRSPGAAGAARGSPAPLGTAAARPEAGLGTGCGSARGERAGGAVFPLPAPGQESQGHRVKPRCAQVSLPFALRGGSGPGPGPGPGP